MTLLPLTDLQRYECRHPCLRCSSPEQVCSTVGVGSTFAVTIPVVEIPSTTPPAVAVATTPATTTAAVLSGQSTDPYCSQPRAQTEMKSERSDVSLSALVEWTRQEDKGKEVGDKEEEDGDRAGAEDGPSETMEGRGTEAEKREGIGGRCTVRNEGERAGDTFGTSDVEERILVALEEGRRGGMEQEFDPECWPCATREAERTAEWESGRGKAKESEQERDKRREEETAVMATDIEAVCPSWEFPDTAATAVAVSASEPPGRDVAGQHVCGYDLTNKSTDNPDATEEMDKSGGNVRVGVGGGGGGGKPFKLKILLAEDSLPNQKLMCRILQRAGHTVEAVSGDDCLRWAPSVLPL